MRFAITVLALLLAPVPALAADTAGLGFDPAQPIAVNADSFAADLNAESGTYTGNVIVIQGEVKLRADSVTVSAPAGRASRLEARGNVIVDSPSGTAKGDAATFDVTQRLVRLTGQVVLTKDNNVMRGTALEVEIATGRARLTGAVAASGQGPAAAQAPAQVPGRVQGLFAPQAQSPATTPSSGGSP